MSAREAPRARRTAISRDRCAVRAKREVGQIGAAGQQHQADGSEQDVERAIEILGLAFVAERVEMRFAEGKALAVCRVKPFRDGAHLGTGLFDRDARFQLRRNVEDRSAGRPPAGSSRATAG